MCCMGGVYTCHIPTWLRYAHTYKQFFYAQGPIHVLGLTLRNTWVRAWDFECSPGLRRHLSALINRDQHLIPLHCPSGKEPHTHSTLMSLCIWLTAPLPSFSFSLDAWVYVSLPKIRFLNLYLSLVTFQWVLNTDTLSFKVTRNWLRIQYVYKPRVCTHSQMPKKKKCFAGCFWNFFLFCTA